MHVEGEFAGGVAVDADIVVYESGVVACITDLIYQEGKTVKLGSADTLTT